MKILHHLFILLFVKIPLQIVAMPVVAIALLFHLKDTRIASSKLEGQRLPKFLSWFDVGDELDIKYGLNGDLGYQAKVFLNADPLPREKLLFNAICVTYDPEQEGKWVPKSKIYWARFQWLALRNPINNFQYSVLGVPTSQLSYPVTVVNKVGIEEVSFIAHSPIDMPPWDILEVGDWTNAGYRYRQVTRRHPDVTRTIKQLALNKERGAELIDLINSSIDTDIGSVWEHYLVYKYPNWLSKTRCFRARIGYKLGHNPLQHDRKVVQWVFSVNPLKEYSGK